MEITGCSCPFLKKLEFSRQIFEKILTYKISRESVHWEPSCSMQTDMAKQIVAFRNFAKSPKMTIDKFLQAVQHVWYETFKTPYIAG